MKYIFTRDGNVMAGRGRGSTLSLTQEQLAALGIARGENSAPMVAPPPLFPKLEVRPLPLPSDATIDYMLLVQQQFAEHLLESPAYVRPREVSLDVERYSDKYKLLSADSRDGRTLECVWNRVPAELRPSYARKRGAGNARKRNHDGDIVQRLQTLEKKELHEETAEEAEEVEMKAAGPDDDDEVLEEEQEYEADDGTDYANNYFDNGEENDDEDDNLDDGPVY